MVGWFRDTVRIPHSLESGLFLGMSVGGGRGGGVGNIRSMTIFLYLIINRER